MGIHNIEELIMPPAKKRKQSIQKNEVDERDLAPDADEKGDPLPDGFKDLVSKKPDEPDHVDKKEVAR